MTTTSPDDAPAGAVEPATTEQGIGREALHRRALDALRAGRFDLVEQVLRDGALDTSTLVENLRVYQAELEIQNEELRASEQQALTALARYTTLFTELPMAGLVVDDYGLILEANPGARGLLALRDIRTHQYFLLRLVHEDDRAAVAAAFQRAKSGGSSALSEVRLAAADGRRFQATLHVALLPAESDHHPHRFVCAAIDQTEVIRQRDALARAYDQLERSEERYRVLADFSPDWDYWYGPDRRFIYVSPACAEVSGYTAEEFREDPELFERIVHPDDRAQWQAHLEDAEAREHKDIGRLPFRIQTRDGRVRWIEHLCMPVVAPDGRYLGRRGVNLDMTSRHEAREALARSEAHFRSIFDAAPLGIAVLDSDGRVVMTNAALRRFLGYDAAELERLTFRDYSHPEELAWDAELYADLVAGRRSSYTRDKRYVRKDGRTVWGRLTVALLRDPTQKTGFAIGMIADIDAQRAAERAQCESERRYHALYESAGEGMSILQNGVFTSFNRAAVELLGYSDEAPLLGKQPAELSPEIQPDGERSSDKQARLLAAMANGKVERFDWEHLRADGSSVLVQVTPIQVQLDGEPALFGVWHDLTERRAAALREARANTVFENTTEGIVVTDAACRIVAVNRAFTEITGYSEEEILGQNPSVLQSGRHDESFYQALWASLERTGEWRGELWNRRKNGATYPQLTTISVVRDPSGAITNYIGVFGDVTQIKRSKALYELAHRDPLTRLANRTLLQARLEQSLLRAAREGRMLALLFLDLDLFKTVNDTLGHPVGDALLQSVAAAMAAQVRSTDSIARLGGDEFVVLLEDIDAPDAAAQLAQRLLGVFTGPFTVQGRELRITASIGISVFPSDGADMDTLLANADVAMYRAKDQGRNNFRFFTPEMTAGAEERLGLQNALRGALSRGELRLELQPQVRLADGCMSGAEVLLRWHSPEHGEVPPARFIPIAEELGLMVELGNWVLEQACMQLADWDAQGFWVPRLAVNLSVLQLEHPALADEVRAITTRTRLEPKRLELEVSESMLMRRAEVVVGNLTRLRDLGLTIAVDDFGSGFSSLAYLKRMPIHRLKIDRSCIDRLTRDANDDDITRAIIALGHSLGLDVIAEGVETEAQADFLRRAGCSEAQGFLFGRPMSAEQIIASAPFSRIPRPRHIRS